MDGRTFHVFIGNGQEVAFLSRAVGVASQVGSLGVVSVEVRGKVKLFCSGSCRYVFKRVVAGFDAEGREVVRTEHYSEPYVADIGHERKVEHVRRVMQRFYDGFRVSLSSFDVRFLDGKILVR